MRVFASLPHAVRGASAVAGFVRSQGRLPALLVVVTMLAVPMERDGDGRAFGLNGLGFGAMLVHGLLFWWMS